MPKWFVTKLKWFVTNQMICYLNLFFFCCFRFRFNSGLSFYGCTHIGLEWSGVCNQRNTWYTFSTNTSHAPRRPTRRYLAATWFSCLHSSTGKWIESNQTKSIFLLFVEHFVFPKKRKKRKRNVSTGGNFKLINFYLNHQVWTKLRSDACMMLAYLLLYVHIPHLRFRFFFFFFSLLSAFYRN